MTVRSPAVTDTTPRPTNTPIARAGKEHSPTRGNQSERRAYLQCLTFLAVIAVHQHWALLKLEYATCVNYKLIDAELRKCAEFYKRSLSKVHCET
jgi:hypothetical protein